MGVTALQTELSAQELEQLLNRVKDADALNTSQASGAGNGQQPEGEQVLCDDFGFPFEPEGMYNSAPIEFEEITKVLWTVLNNLNHAAIRYNRLSPYYPMLMQQLEKNIKHMGSLCITKVVLEQGGQEFPALSSVTIEELYKMVSVQFRKCCGAYNDFQKEDHMQEMSIITWLLRWAALSERLKSTQEKINRIKSGEVKVETLLKRETVYKDEPKMQRDMSHRMVSASVRASSLPIIKSFANVVKKQVREEEKECRAAEREAKREAERAQGGGPRGPMYRPSYILPASPEKLEKLSRERAVSGDRETGAGGQIERGQGPGDEGQWAQVGQTDRDQGPEAGGRWAQAGPCSGPSPEKRKALRENRKKKKK